MNKFQCDIEADVDNTGTITFTAVRCEDYDMSGIIIPKSIRGTGETELEAVIDLCEKLLQLEN